MGLDCNQEARNFTNDLNSVEQRQHALNKRPTSLPGPDERQRNMHLSWCMSNSDRKHADLLSLMRTRSLWSSMCLVQLSA